MLSRSQLAALGLLFAAAGRAAEPAPPAAVLYRIETAGQGVLWSEDRPVQSGEQIFFHQHPGGTLVSLRRLQVRRVSAQRVAAGSRGWVDVGLTGGSGRRDTEPASASGKAATRLAPGPGARPDGTALFNPDRKYQPDIDSKRVPGMNTGYPNSPNDYREGRTIGFPAAPATQAAPGEPPKMPAGNGEVPKGPQSEVDSRQFTVNSSDESPSRLTTDN